MLGLFGEYCIETTSINVASNSMTLKPGLDTALMQAMLDMLADLPVLSVLEHKGVLQQVYIITALAVVSLWTLNMPNTVFNKVYRQHSIVATTLALLLRSVLSILAKRIFACRHAQRLLKYGFVLGPQFNSDSNLPPDDADSVPATMRRNAPSNVILNIADLRNTMNEAAAEEQEEGSIQGEQQHEHPYQNDSLLPSHLVDATGVQSHMGHPGLDSSGHMGAEYSQHQHVATSADLTRDGHQHSEVGSPPVEGSIVGRHMRQQPQNYLSAPGLQHQHLSHFPAGSVGTLSHDAEESGEQSVMHQNTSHELHSQLAPGVNMTNQSAAAEQNGIVDGNNLSMTHSQDAPAQHQGILAGSPALRLPSVLIHGNPAEQRIQQLGERLVQQTSAVRGNRPRVHVASVRFAEEPDQT